MNPDNEKLQREQTFHDEWAANIDPTEVPLYETFTLSTCPETRWLLKQLGDIKGKKLLELGSGAGEGSVFFSLQGASVTATDLSPGMLQVVEKLAKYHNTLVTTQLCSAEDLSPFPDNSFDIVYAANLLHHVDISKCLAEVHRVLKPGGMAAFWDPVAYNPAINVYRRMATQVRTTDEHPLRYHDVKTAENIFYSVRKRFFWFTTLIVFLKFYLIDGINPNADRYWKRIISHESGIRWLYKPLAALDTIILTILPFLGWWCWNIAILARKQDTQ